MSPNGNAASLGQRYTEGVRRHGHEPLLTYYDDRSGERTELSYATFDNWAAKAANLLVEECDARIGTRLSLSVVDHWTGAVIAAAAWKVGAVVVIGPGTDGAAADLLVVPEAAAGDHAGSAGLIVIGTGMGGRVSGEVEGIAFGNEVLAFADDYDDPDVSVEAQALEVAGRTWGHAELAAEATGLLVGGGRVLSTAPLDSAGGIIAALVAPLVADASAVWCPHLEPEGVAHRAEQERVTHRATDGAAITPI